MKSTVWAATVAFLALLPAGSVSAGATACPSFYAGGAAPEIANPKLAQKVREICYSEFGVFHSGVTATPLWSAQHLTAAAVRQAKKVDREDVFHAEGALPPSERAELSHYRRSGYDRGHMAPAADMATKRAQDEGFSLANMVPQIPDLNRGSWADLEEVVRSAALKKGEVFVVTGPIFAGAKLKTIGGRVVVPTQTYKVVYVPSDNVVYAWTGDNATGKVARASVEAVERAAGVKVFPALAGGSQSAPVDQRGPSGSYAEPDPPPRAQGQWVWSLQDAWKYALGAAVLVVGYYSRKRRW